MPTDGIDTLSPPDGGPPESATVFPVQVNPWRSEPKKSQFLDVLQNFLSQIDLDGLLPGGATDGSVGIRATTTGASGPSTQWKRMIIGRVDGGGTVDAGTGFTVNRPSTGTFDVTFTAQFSALPAVIALV